ncbi:MAG: MerR family transcriptional regulator [Chloroflexi bacterium]|nr:MerR family transcriptional regulator [Chloroflexota bacterium]
MEMREIVTLTRVPAKTIRYYEQINLLPPPGRRQNGYREYSKTDVDRLRLVAGLRRLDFSLDEVKEILDLRDRRLAPCKTLLNLLDKKANEIRLRINELERLDRDIKKLRSLGLKFPTDDVEGKNCVCHLVSNQGVTTRGSHGS